MGLSKKQAERVRAIYDDFEECEPDISTERLLQMTADQATHELRREVDVGDVADALAAGPNALPTKPGAR